jgi:uncharacterized repeat protein (TIGR01451 family)
MKLNKGLFLAATLALLVVGSSLNPTKVKADSYSSEDNRKTLSIDKKLRSIFSSEYVDNISSSTKVFAQGEIVEFKIKVTNTGTTRMKNIKVTDELPPFLKLIFFPGTYNSTDNKIEWTIDELNAGNSQEFLVRAKIDKAENVKTLAKETNVAKASVDGINEKDDATYYIGTRSGVIVPETGNPALVLETIGVITAGISGLALRRKIRGY